MKNILLFLLFTIFIATSMVFAETNCFSQTETEEVVSTEMAANRKAEGSMTLEAWHDLLLDLSKNLDKENQKVEEFNFMRPMYSLNMYYSVLGTITEKDVEEVKKANAGTNTLSWSWSRLHPYLYTIACPMASDDKFEFANAWRKSKYEPKKDTINDGISPQLRFVWFVMQAYAENIWDEWYECWKNETKKPAPRISVLKKLKSDFASLEIFLLPYLYEALKVGDDTLLRIISSDNGSFQHPVPHDHIFQNLKTKEDFFLWWDSNRDSYMRKLSAEEGLKQAVQNAELSVKYLETSPSEIQILKKWAEEIGEYYRKPVGLREKAYWYYNIGDEEIDGWDKFSEALRKHGAL